MSGSGISWAICKSAPRPRQITTPAPHHSRFLQARCPSCRPTNSVEALKAIINTITSLKISSDVKYDYDQNRSHTVIEVNKRRQCKPQGTHGRCLNIDITRKAS